jgi:hypothetical protein
MLLSTVRRRQLHYYACCLSCVCLFFRGLRHQPIKPETTIQWQNLKIMDWCEFLRLVQQEQNRQTSVRFVLLIRLIRLMVYVYLSIQPPTNRPSVSQTLRNFPYPQSRNVNQQPLTSWPTSSSQISTHVLVLLSKCQTYVLWNVCSAGVCVPGVR